MNYRLHQMAAYCGVAAIILFFVGFVVAGIFPPPSPSSTVAEVASRYREHANGIRTGMLIIMISSIFTAPMFGLISHHMQRIGGASRTLAYAQLLAGAAGMVTFFLPPLIFLATAFRPDRDAELTFLMNDLGWIFMILPWTPAFVQAVAIGLATLNDRDPSPIFPRWLGYVNLWVALGFLPATLVPFFKFGPFAWNGLFGFWVGANVFGIWFITMVICLAKANRRERDEPRGTLSSPAI